MKWSHLFVISLAMVTFLFPNIADISKAQDTSIALEEPEDLNDNVTVDPTPGTDLSNIDQAVTIIFDNEFDSSTLGVAVTVKGEGLPGRIFFPNNMSLKYVPDHGYAYGESVEFFIKGGEEGLLWSNGTQALGENLSFTYFMPLPEKFLSPIRYIGMQQYWGHLTLYNDEGNSMETLESGYLGVFPLPGDFNGGFGVFDNGERPIDVQIARYSESVFLSWGDLNYVDHPPYSGMVSWNSTTENITFQFSLHMNRTSVEEHLDTDGLKGDIVWDGRYLTFIPGNRDPASSYNVTIEAGAESLWGEELSEDVWMKIPATGEESVSLEHVVVFFLLLIFLFVMFFVSYSKAAYGGPK